MREQLELGKQREIRLKQQAQQLAEERETLAELYCTDRRRETLAHRAFLTTMASANSELAARLQRKQ